MQLNIYVQMLTIQFGRNIVNDALFRVRILDCRIVVLNKVALQGLKQKQTGLIALMGQ